MREIEKTKCLQNDGRSHFQNAASVFITPLSKQENCLTTIQVFFRDLFGNKPFMRFLSQLFRLNMTQVHVRAKRANYKFIYRWYLSSKYP